MKRGDKQLHMLSVPLLKSKLIIDHRPARFSSVLLISLGFNESACVTIFSIMQHLNGLSQVSS